MGFFFDLVTQSTGGRNLDTSDEALDSAAGFQDGFREYLPLYNDYTGSALSLETDIQRPYDELREIDFRRLSEVAERGAAVADEFQETREATPRTRSWPTSSASRPRRRPSTTSSARSRPRPARRCRRRRE
jgi:hypothetical protein